MEECSSAHNKDALSGTIGAIERNRSRYIGNRGERTVQLIVFVDDNVAKRFVILHTWLVKDRNIISSFSVLEPEVLAKTRVRMEETAGDFTLELSMSFGSTSMRKIASPLSRQFVLGTDFTYEDLRLLLPPCRYGPASDTQTSVSLDSCVVIARYPDCIARHSFALSCEIPYFSEWVWDAFSERNRTVASFGIQKTAGVSMPTRMVATRGNARFRTEMALLSLRINPTQKPLAE